jgi:hypothetical protein
VPTSESSQYRAEVLVFGGAGRRRPDSAICRKCPVPLSRQFGREHHRGGDSQALGRKGVRAFSAGTRRAPEVYPLAVDLLNANRIWGQGLRPKDCREFLGEDAPRMDFVISLGSEAPDGLPSSWPGDPHVIHWRISEPRVDGKPAENMRTIGKRSANLRRASTCSFS